MRNSRTSKESLALKPVADYPVAPHRYLWTRDEPSHEKGRECIQGAPYQPGDVVLVVYGDSYRRAYVVSVLCKRDRFDDLREYYRVLPETKAGHWSRLWVETHPGLIQRAYFRAGQAPEIPAETWS